MLPVAAGDGGRAPCRRIFPLARGSPRHGNDAQTLRFCVTSSEPRTRLARPGHSRCRARTRGAGPAQGPRTPQRPSGQGSPCARVRAPRPARVAAPAAAGPACRPASHAPAWQELPCGGHGPASLPSIVHEETGRLLLCRCHRAAPRGGVTRDRAAVLATCAAARARNRSSLIVPLARSAGQPPGGCQVRPFSPRKGARAAAVLPSAAWRGAPRQPGDGDCRRGALGRMPGAARRGRGRHRRKPVR
jgi:hypothetical protein